MGRGVEKGKARPPRGPGGSQVQALLTDICSGWQVPTDCRFFPILFQEERYNTFSPAPLLQTSLEKAALAVKGFVGGQPGHVSCPASRPPARSVHQLAGAACVCSVLTGALERSENCFLQGLAVFV